MVLFQYKLQLVGVPRPDLLEPQRTPREQTVFVSGAAAADRAQALHGPAEEGAVGKRLVSATR